MKDFVPPPIGSRAPSSFFLSLNEVFFSEAIFFSRLSAPTTFSSNQHTRLSSNERVSFLLASPLLLARLVRPPSPLIPLQRRRIVMDCGPWKLPSSSPGTSQMSLSPLFCSLSVTPSVPFFPLFSRGQPASLRGTPVSSLEKL